MIQIRYFPDGGFVLHQLPCPGRALHASAWFDKRGAMHACEAIHFQRGRRVALPVKTGGPIWQSLAAHGPRHSRTLYVESLT